MVLMGMALLQVGVTNVRMEVGRNRLVTATSFTSRRDAEERYNRHAGAENMVTIWILICQLIEIMAALWAEQLGTLSCTVLLPNIIELRLSTLASSSSL